MGGEKSAKEGTSPERTRPCEHNAEPSVCPACAVLVSTPFTFTYLRKNKRSPTPPKAYVPPIRYDEKNPHLTSSDAQTARGVVQEQAKRIEDLTQEVTELKKELLEAQTTNREVSAFLNNEIVSKEQLGRKLEAALDQRAKQSETQARNLRGTMHRQLRAQKGEFDVVELGLRRELAELREDNKQLLHFREQQRQMDETVSELKGEIARLKEELEKQDYDWHQRTRTTQGALEAEYRNSLERARDEARVEARKELSEEVRVLIRQKAAIERELDEQLQAREQYLKERAQLRQEVGELRRDATGRAEQVQEVQKQLHTTHRHNSELFLACKALKGKVESLLSQIDQLKAQDGTAVPGEMGKTNSDAEESKLEFERMERELADRDRRLREIRKVARKLLNQRSMVETFLIDAIESCREQIFLEHKQRQIQERRERLGTQTTPRMPQGKPGYPPISARGIAGHPQIESSTSGAVVPMPALVPSGGLGSYGSPVRPQMLPLQDRPKQEPPESGGPGGEGPAGGAFLTGVPDLGMEVGLDPSSVGFDGAGNLALGDGGAGGADGGEALPSQDHDLRRAVPLSKLSWRQREQILKMLFKKINEEGTTSTWKMKNKLRSL